MLIVTVIVMIVVAFEFATVLMSDLRTNVKGCDKHIIRSRSEHLRYVFEMEQSWLKQRSTIQDKS